MSTVRGKVHSGWRRIILEFDSVKAEEASCRANPQVAIFGLSKRADFAGGPSFSLQKVWWNCTILRSPSSANVGAQRSTIDKQIQRVSDLRRLR